MKFLTRPGRAKKRLWQVCLHEAAHGLACSYLLNIPSTCRVFHRGGYCQQLRSSSASAAPAAHTAYIAAGRIAESLPHVAGCNQIPAGRPRFGRGRFRRRVHRLANDTKQVATIIQSSELLKDPDIADLCKPKWEQTAETFVLCRRKLIVEIAIKLYLTGTVYVPAKSESNCDWAADYVAGR